MVPPEPNLMFDEAASVLVDLARVARHGLRFARDARKLVPYALTTPARLLEQRAKRNAQDLALAYRDERYSWSGVNERANQYASWLARKGVGAGDVVALLLDNRPDFLFALMGLSKLGAVGALVNNQLVGPALAHAITVSGAKRILVGAEHLQRFQDLEAAVLEKLESWVLRDCDAPLDSSIDSVDAEIRREPMRNRWRTRLATNKDVFCFVYTSGTTGLPKAAVIRNQRMLGANLLFGHIMHRAGVGDVIYVPLPLFHSNGLFLGWGSALATGAAIALRRKFSVTQFWRDVRDFGATSFVYIGELCRYLLQAPVRPEERQHHLRVAVGNGLRPEIWDKFQARFGIPVIREFYGSTEGNAPAINWRGKPGMIGRLGRLQAVIRCDPETGEVARNAKGFCEELGRGETGLLVGKISTLLTFDGYVDAKATEQKVLTNVFRRGDRYFNTGDLVQLHEGRWLSFVDRLGDTYRWKGENVSTQEVAEILHEAPGVQDAIVFGVAIPGADGKAGMAALRLSGRFQPGPFASYARKHLASAQRPLFVRVLGASMNLTSTLKPQKGEYRREGYDPRKVDDPLFVLRKDRYLRLTSKLYAEIERGAWLPG